MNSATSPEPVENPAQRPQSAATPGWRIVASARLSTRGSLAGARPIRFGVVGAVTFALQLALLTLLTSASLGSVVAYAVALALAVQFNFVVNQLLVWHDRPLTLSRAHIAERWLSFHGFIALSLAVNMAGFIVAEWFVPDLAAAVIAVGASTLIKFVSLDRLVFR